MKLEYSSKKISFKKELNELDKFTIEFCSILDELKIKYVLISGYVSILFGRNRASEDVDLFMEKIDFSKFKQLWEKLSNSFECITTSNIEDSYNTYISKGIAIRFAKKEQYIPNMEVKFPKTTLDNHVISNRIEVSINKEKLYISPLELQIIFKLFLGKGGNEKDLEDARYLFVLFKEHLDKNVLEETFRKLNIPKEFKRYIE